MLHTLRPRTTESRKNTSFVGDRARVTAIRSSHGALYFLIAPWVGVAHSWIIALILVVWGLWLGSGSCAQDSPFDTWVLRNKTQCVGVFLGRRGPDASIAVRRGWMQKNERVFRDVVKDIDAMEREAEDLLRVRLERLLEKEGDTPYRFFLETELERTRGWLAQETPAPSELILWTLPAVDVARWNRASANQQKLAWWAWYKQIDAPESAAASKLKSQLEELRVDLRSDPPDLGLRFQAVPQTEDEWNARLAIVRYSWAKSVEFQGTPDLMVRIEDRTQPADVAALLAQSMKGQTENLLEELLGNGKRGQRGRSRDWVQECVKKLKPEETYFRGTCIEVDATSGSASLESVFAVQLTSGNWQRIWRDELVVSADQVDNKAVQQLEADPQIQSLKQVLGTLGVGGNDALDRALRVGAATQQAQAQIDSRFEFFRQRYLKRLDLPVLRWDVVSP